ncbi:hypothetical protein ILUMI_10769 [Ignelater luminosus]|uniref:Uncharacterized protein n=1 Tax=Ignelater luminosus TaxID=2038154 RepID=A0A8K0D6D9_IGNLU|nr:hypothetical protein ILUMI_10769 [Ignelater luminosus]
MIIGILPGHSLALAMAWRRNEDLIHYRNGSVIMEREVNELCARVNVDLSNGGTRERVDQFQAYQAASNNREIRLREGMLVDGLCGCNPFADIEFSGARAARDAKRRNLKANATKRKVSLSALTTEELSKVVSIWDAILLKVCNKSCFTLSDTSWPGTRAKKVAAVYSTFRK